MAKKSFAKQQETIEEVPVSVPAETEAETRVFICSKTNFETAEGFWHAGVATLVTPERADELRAKYPNIF